MQLRDAFQLILFLAILLATAKPLGTYIDRVMEGPGTEGKGLWSWRIFKMIRFAEQRIYILAGINPEEDQTWVKYTLSLMGFSMVGLVLTLAILMLQNYLPLNPMGMPGLSWHLALNTAVSFTTNTNWQSYGGESTLSYLSQMVGLTIHNFLSAAVGLSVAVALVRGIARHQSKGIGNFWTDLVRSTLYVFLPLSFIFAIFLMSQGMIQNFSPYQEVTTLEGAKQVIAQGPVASQIAIKMLGTNGGGFFNANAAHPYENPTPLSNFVQMLSIFLIPSALVYLLGRRVKNLRHGWSVWVAMAVLFVGGVILCNHFEQAGNPLYQALGCASSANLEGKEVRFGIFNSALFATITTDASCGAVNAMHDSFTPLGGLIPLVNMLLSEVVFGGVGAGLYGMLMYVLLTVFIAGLMVGRTPEYLGKKIEGREIKFVMIAMVVMAASMLGFTAGGVLDTRGLAGLANAGPHGLSEILYAYTSATANNGSAFAGLSANTPFWNLTLAVAMFVGRSLMLIPMLAVAGSLAHKKIHPGGEASFPVDGALFVSLLIGIILLVGALTFFPVLALSPVLEHLEMLRGNLFK